MVMDTYPDQVVIKKEESSGNEEDEDELQEEDLDNNDNQNSNSYSSAFTTIDRGQITSGSSRRLLDWRQWSFIKSYGWR